ncbi:LPS-assembly protein LptD [Shewanella sp. NFH-SH190041]|uniref:LPS assembly protein LptD n=1 Tax=Shewanella sp. NFH-SH190041 TaxID=2950245 RepID=UPI0021C3A92F|nr:LPS assembly protein LptD [Shewanella sp. NFH-SH190041]BDM65542.1 LPS-assembly protein LptD [Shewanella sp. NFH-SH190041]
MQIRYLVALSLFSQFAMAGEPPADTVSQCLVEPPVPRPEAPVSGNAINKQLISISSESSEAQMGKEAKFQGNVTFKQGQRRIQADEAILNQQDEKLDANGNLVFQDSMFTVTADSLVARMKSNSATLKGAQYWLHGQQVHGDAKKLEITPNNNLLLTDTNFTTCPPDDASWLLEANKIKIDSSDEWGEIWGAKLRIGGIPVLYIPYMTIPVSDKRKTGFLFPNFSTSTTNGVEVSIPWYWNIAPEYDLTFTPNIMSNRGLFLKTEFRYLAGEAQQGKVNVEYLGDDQKLTGHPNRYLYHWEHQGAIDENWRVLANYTGVSDNNYFNDLPSDVARATDNQISRVGEISYFQQNWNTSLKVQDVKVLGETQEPYQVMPQFSFNYSSPDMWRNLDFAFHSEVSNFEHTSTKKGYPTATRVHLEPSLTWPIYGPAGAFVSEVKLYQTNYWQRDNRLQPELASHVSRTIPQARLYGQINFERHTKLFDENYRQTLEPQVQYLYVGYQDQSDIGIYDTAALQDDFYGLFRDRRYSGLDRIANANQVTVGMTSRLYDSHNEEQMKFSLGQIFYLEDNKVSLNPNLVEETPSFSVLAAEMDAKLYQDFYFSGALQYDTKEKDNKKTEVTLDYRPGANQLVQLSYRYVPDLLNTNTNNRVDISQAGLRTAWPVRDDLYFVGSWYYDLKEHRSVEAYTGFQYESCCWAVRLSYHYRINTNYDDKFDPVDDRAQFESGFYLNFMLKGLGGSGPLGVSKMLDQGLFSYRKPLYLKN